MAGYSRLYCVGGLGGYQGSDGINPIWIQIWVSEGDRQAWVAHQVDPSVRSMGNLQVVIPKGPNHPHTLIDSCLAFMPDLFDGCPSLVSVRSEIGAKTRLDFDLHPDRVPKQWSQLRAEASKRFSELNIFEARLAECDLESGPYGRLRFGEHRSG